MTKKLTTTQSPMMKQYKDLKEKHPDALILFRCGDFYETYCDDASAAAAILGITLTRRKQGEETINLAGFPCNAFDDYLPKLVRAGKRVAISDQLEGVVRTSINTKLEGQQQPKEIVRPSNEEKPSTENSLGDADALAALKEQMEKQEQADLKLKNERLQQEVNELEAELAKVRTYARNKITEIIKTTLISGVTISTRLDTYFATCLDCRLEYIKLKRDAKIALNDADIQYLIQRAEENN